MNFLKESLKTIQKKRQKGIAFYRIDEAEQKKTSYSINIEEETLKNNDYRRVLYTTEHTQLVLMSVEPNQEIGMETHTGSQFIRFEAGKGKVVIGDVERNVTNGDAIVVPAGVEHNVINTSEDEPMKLYALYSPPQHAEGQVDKTKADEPKHKEV